MIAVSTFYQVQEKPTFIHRNVEQIKNDLHLAHRRFKCNCCGREWEENINAFAQVIESKEVENNLEQYYPNYKDCKEL